ncbi:MAG: hypothetical protein KUG78_01365 [Kangiellaceae bacterium]|nr:hypothetical protein [Kangiellaceae bacterium]
MKMLLKMVSIIYCTMLVAIEMPINEGAFGHSDRCYSVYHLKQKLRLEVVFGESAQKQYINSNFDIHVREIEPQLDNVADSSQSDLEKNIDTFVFLIKPKKTGSLNLTKEYVDKYQHPFLVNFDSGTGELISIDSTAQDTGLKKEFLGYVDLFQYTEKEGSYAYRNGNGNYNASVSHANGSGQRLNKINQGYTDDNSALTVNRSEFSIVLEESSDTRACFYHSAKGDDLFTSSMGKSAYVRGKGSVEISVTNSSQLPLGHYFYSLTSDLTQWPTYSAESRISEEQAFALLPDFIIQLQSLIDDKAAFAKMMKSKKHLWPFLADFMADNSTNFNLANRVIWSLNHINSTESISALLKVTMSDLPDKSVYRSIVTLITTSAAIDEDGIEQLTGYLTEMKFSDDSSQHSLLLLRTLGALAKHRSQYSPNQAAQIKQYLYNNIEGASDQFKASIYDSIGAMGETVDREGIELLVNGLAGESITTKNAAINALEKLPYQKDNSDLYISEFDRNQDSGTKSKLIALLGNTSHDDVLAKDKLLSIVGGTTAAEYKRTSITSLDRVKFDYGSDEIEILKSHLRRETDKSTVKKLARLVLKYQRQNPVYP